MIFLRYGQSMRAKSHFAREANAIVANMHTDEPVDSRQAERDEKAASLTTSNEAWIRLFISVMNKFWYVL